MLVHKSIALILQFLLIAVIGAGVLWGGWWVLNLNLNTTEAELRVKMSRLQASAQSYYSRLQYYEGVCNDIGIPANWRCHSNETAFAVEFTLSGGTFYCMDSSGFLGETRVSKGSTFACRSY